MPVRTSGGARFTSWTGSIAKTAEGHMSYRDRVSSPGPKKLLAFDGGGIRGVITLEVLRRLESMLAEQLGAGDDFVLGDYFDYIGGTSTGAVIAAGLAKGLRVGQLLDLYVSAVRGHVRPRVAAASLPLPLRQPSGFGSCCRACSARTPRSATTS